MQKINPDIIIGVGITDYGNLLVVSHTVELLVRNFISLFKNLVLTAKLN